MHRDTACKNNTDASFAADVEDATGVNKNNITTDDGLIHPWTEAEQTGRKINIKVFGHETL